MHVLRVACGLAFVLLWAVVVVPVAAAQDVAPPLYKLHAMLDRPVESQGGEAFGHIEEVVLEAATGAIAYAVVTTRGFLGLGEHMYAVPWQALRLSAEEKALTLAMTAEQLKNAPRFSREEWPDLDDEHWGNTVQAYYGKPLQRGQQLTLEPAPEPSPPRPRRLLRSPYVLRSTVMNTRGQRLGEIEEVVFDATSGAVAYAVLAFGGVLGMQEKFFALPWHTLQPSAGFGTFTLAVDKEALQDAPGFHKAQWPKMADARWAAATPRHD